MAEGIELRSIGKSAGASASRTTLPPAYTEQEPAPGSLGRNYRTAEDRAKAAARPHEGAPDAASVYGMYSAGWFVVLAVPLLLMPRLVLFMAQGSESPVKAGPLGVVGSGPIPSYGGNQHDKLTPLESFALKMLGLGLLALAAISIFVVVPNYSPQAMPYRIPTVCVFAVLGCVTAFAGWNAPLGVMSIVLGLGNGALGAWGFWTVFFGEEKQKFGKYLKPNSRLKKF